MPRNSNSVLRTGLCDSEVPTTSLEAAAGPPGWRRDPVRDRGPDSAPPQEPSSSQTLGVCQCKLTPASWTGPGCAGCHPVSQPRVRHFAPVAPAF